MSELAGLLATVSAIACAILLYHAWQQQRRVDQIEESLRAVGSRLHVPAHELPQAPASLDEYEPGARVDDETANREWQEPRAWRRWDS